jgi:putative zinc finger/helix-turn-helix YgiT family protein
MKCFECGAGMTVSRETITYTQSGLPNVRIRNIEVRRCSACGEVFEVIPRIEQLHAFIARQVATKKARLTREEVVFLRKWLGWDRAEFAARMDVRPETVSRWETGGQAISGTTERLLRLMALTQQPRRDYSLDALKDVAKGAARPLRVELAERNHQWELVAA